MGSLNYIFMIRRLAHWPTIHDEAERLRRERSLAVARVLLSVAGLVAIYLDPSEPTRFARLAYTLLAVYVAHSIAILLVVRRRRSISPHFPMFVHVTGVVWAAVISLFTSGPSSAFFVFFIFVILAAAYRWRMRESFITTLVLAVVLVIQAVLFSIPSVAAFLGTELDLNRLIMRGAYLLIMGFFAGFLGEKEKQASAEIAAVNALLSQVSIHHQVEKNFDILVAATRDMFHASSAMLVVHELAQNRFELVEHSGGSLVRRELSQAEGEALFSSDAGKAKLSPNEPGRRDHADSGAQSVAVVGNPFATNRCLVANSEAGDDWRVRMFVLDPRPSFGDEQALFLQRLLSQLVPSIHNVFLVRRIREQVGAFERARIARDLHDGPVQSLSSARLQMDVLRDRLRSIPEFQQDVVRISDIIRNEVLAMRDLIQNLRTSTVEPREFVPAILEFAARFERETGIGVRVVASPDQIDLPPATCSELLRVVQEALINVRRHSGAETVLLTLNRQGQTWRLIVDDDGRGFPFEGNLSWSELQDGRKGPVVIKERVRLLGGELRIESKPGCGSKLEIAIPIPGKA